MSYEQLRFHECGHATAFTLLGIPVLRVEMWGEWNGAGGHVIPARMHGLDKALARDYMLALLAAPMMADEPVPDWPLRRNAATKDEVMLAVYAEYLGMDEHDYLQLRIEAWKFTCTDEFVRLFTGLSGLMERVPRINGDAVSAVAKLAEPKEC